MSAELDVGPLSWVKDEIDLALERAAQSLASAGTLPEARASLHQAGGALAIVGLAGVDEFSAAIEGLLAAAADGGIGWGETQAEVARAAIAALRGYLDELMAGAPNQPLRLLPAYRSLAQARGGPPPAPSELFFPDLTQRPPHRESDSPALSPEALAARLKAARLGFERGLLKWLKDDAAGVRDMRNSVAIVEQTQNTPAARAFWWVTLAFFDAVAVAPAADGRAEVGQLCRRIDAQIRKLQDGSQAVAERLMRDVLYRVATTPGGGAHADVVRAAYRLADLVPDRGLDVEAERRRQTELHRFDEETRRAGQAWDRFCLGAAAALPEFHETSARLADLVEPLGRVDLTRLTAAIVNTANLLRRNPLVHGDALAEEMTTALLLCEAAVEELGRPGATLEGGFAEQVDRVTSRMSRLVRGERLGGEAPPRLDAVARRAREKRLLGQVGKQIVNRLAVVEQALDGYFRNPAERRGLDAVNLPLKQVEGAFALLDEARALAVLRDCARAIAGFAAGDAADTAAFERVARQLSALQAFVEALPHGGGDLDRLLGEAGVPAAEQTASVEREVVQTVDATRTLVLNLRGLAGAAREDTCASIRRNLETLQDDALLVADDSLQQRAEAALAALGQGDEALAQAMDALAPSPAAPPPSARTAAQPVGDADAELLAIFIEEARQEMRALDQLLAALERDSADRSALAAVRRSFHTLKGSGRMVGLTDLGEAAWAMEQVMNALLAADAAADATLTQLLREAVALFERWTASLEAGTPGPAVATFIAHCRSALSYEAAAAPVESPPATPVQVGKLSLAPALYATFLEEARTHLSVLEHGDLRAAAEAARVLSSTAATVGFGPLAALAEKLAAALVRFTAAARMPDADSAPALAEAVATLRVMVEAIANGHAPDRAEELLDALDSLVPAMAGESAAGEIDPQLLPVFLDESAELTATISTALRAWGAAPQNDEFRDRIQRQLHTLKGSARMAGALRLGDLIHDLEGRVAAASIPAAADLAHIEAGFDRIAALIDALGRSAGGASPATPSRPAEANAESESDLGAAPPTLETADAETATALLRVRSDRIDQLINDAGEIAIARSRVEAELRGIKTALAELTENVSRLRNQLREIEIQAESSIAARHFAIDELRDDFDPLEMDRYTRFQELTRIIAESVNDVSTVQHGLLRNLEHAQTALAAQGRLNRDVSQGLLRVRMVAFEAIAERLHRTVRQAARDAGRRVQLEIRGGQTELDRAVLDRLVGPIEHLLRNAVVHGIEAPAARTAAGKPETGTITIGLVQRSGEISLELRDDGAGLDLPRIRQKAVEGGFLKADEAADEHRLVQLIFLPGLTTATAVSAVAGRGVGMDVVRSEVMGLGGRVDVQSGRGTGSAFILTLPASMAISQALLVMAGRRRYAIPSAMVEQAVELASGEIEEVRCSGGYRWKSRDYPWQSLARVLGEAESGDGGSRRHWLLLIRAGSQHMALEPAAMLGNHEVVMKPVGPQLARVPGIAGATVLGDGEIVLIVNPVALVAGEIAHLPPRPPSESAQVESVLAPLVMVVDDSLTVRKVTGRLLERAGYRVQTAKDGADALEKLADETPQALLADIEMPRMDGFDLVRSLRADARWRDLPVIMITSRTADKHRTMAQGLGVEHFLGKPYDEATLLDLLADLCGR